MRAFKAVKQDAHDSGKFFPLMMFASHKFEVGGVYETKDPVAKLCANGFHGCRHLVAVFKYEYGYDLSDPVLEVLLDKDVETDGYKYAGTRMTILRVVPPEEIAAAIAGHMRVFRQVATDGDASPLIRYAPDVPGQEVPRSIAFVDGRCHLRLIQQNRDRLQQGLYSLALSA